MSSLLCFASCKLPKCNIRQKARRLAELVSPLKTKIVKSSLVQSIKRKKKQYDRNSMHRTLSESIRDNLGTSSSINLGTSSNSERGPYIRRSMTGINISSRNQINTQQQASMALYPNYYIPQLRPFYESPPPELPPTPMRDNRSVSDPPVPYTAPPETWRIGGLQGRQANQGSEPLLAIINPMDRENPEANAPIDLEGREFSEPINLEDQEVNEPAHQESLGSAPFFAVKDPINRVNRAVSGLTTDQSSSTTPGYNADQRRSTRRQAPREHVDRYTGSRYRSINNNVVRIYPTGNNYRRQRPHPIRYIDTPAYQATRPECQDNSDRGSLIVESRKEFLRNGLIRMLDPREFSLKNPLENWRIGGKLGSGINGMVRVARSRAFYNRATYAVKTVFTKPYFVAVDDRYNTVLTEVRIMRAKHSNIVNLKHVFLQNDIVTIFMDKQATCVFDVLEKLNRGLDEGLAIYVTHEVLKGLHYMYNALGYFHGDIKTENILVGPRGEIKLADFGHSRPIHTNWEGGIGTAEYMAPEVKERFRTFNEKSDIWSLALMIELVLMFTRFDAFSSRAFYRNPRISPTLKIIVSSMLQFNEEDRPSVNQLLATFQDHFRCGRLLLGTNRSMVAVLQFLQLI